MKIAIEHSTTWHDDSNAGIVTQLLRMTPRCSARQQLMAWDLALPCPATRGTDSWGNVQHVLTLESPRRDICLTARGVVEIHPDAEEGDDGLNPLLFLRNTGITQADAGIADLADNVRGAAISRDILRALMIAIGSEVRREASSFSGLTAAEALARRAGTCHDQTHVFLACARLLAVPARYVNGYMYGAEGNQVSSHGWAEAYVHGRWHSFDVGNRLDRQTTHLKLAIGMDYLDACPVRGVRFGRARERMSAATLVAQAQQPNQ